MKIACLTRLSLDDLPPATSTVTPSWTISAARPKTLRIFSALLISNYEMFVYFM
jgi:hypothetical protein